VQGTDYLSTIKFDRTGKFLAAGDLSGRVIIFEFKYDRYTYLGETNSFLSCYDSDKTSKEYQSRVNGIGFFPQISENALNIVYTNDRLI